MRVNNLLTAAALIAVRRYCGSIVLAQSPIQ